MLLLPGGALRHRHRSWRGSLPARRTPAPVPIPTACQFAANVQASWIAVLRVHRLFQFISYTSDVDLFNSRYSQALALFHSRITVIGAIFKTSAVSSTLSPPKN